MDIQPASSLEQYVTHESYAPAGAGRATPGASDAGREQAPAEGEPPSIGAAMPAAPAIYGSNARPVAARMAASSISLLA